ncbi:MAG: carbon monoxide dehydrogenase subunit G [Pseudomonadota bacterium]
MQLTGEKVLGASRDEVFRALHDPATLRQAIPGCKRFVRVSDDRYEAEVAVKVGPISGTYKAAISVYNDDPPMGYSLHGHADGGLVAGGADGNAHVALAVVDGSTTNLAYHIAASLNGPLAEVGADVAEKVGRTLVSEFFSRLELIIADDPDGEFALEEYHVPPEPVEPEPVAPPEPQLAETVRPASEGTPMAQAATFSRVEPSSAPAAPAATGWGQASRDAPVVASARRREERPGMGRWLLVALGVLIIAILLQDGF